MIKKQRKHDFNFTTRSAGVLLHPTSLPGGHGVGDIGPASRAFADFLADAKQRWWQMLPVCPPSRPPGWSPYSSDSAFAGSPLLISLDDLVEDGLLDRQDLKPTKDLRADRVNYPAVAAFKADKLRLAFANFYGDKTSRNQLDRFAREQSDWLDDYALFAAMRARHPEPAWNAWPAGLRDRTPAGLRDARGELADEIAFQSFVQFMFEKQWARLHAYCTDRGVGLIGDIPIFVAFDSADVWANRKLFLLNRDGEPTVVSGCPPDMFAKTGQRWDHPHYDWPAHKRTKYAWWIKRLAMMFRRFDAVRIDHFIGFSRVWAVDPAGKGATKGKWMSGPGKPFFDAVREQLGDVAVIAEDLGALTPEAAKLRDDCKLPGMRVLQFGLTKDGDPNHRPHHFPKNCVAYTGTHDNATTAGWVKSLMTDDRKYASAYLHAKVVGDITLAMVRACYASVADTAIIPMQDLLGLDDAARMNLPGTDDNNWQWRMTAMPNGNRARLLADQSLVYDRA